MLVIIIHMFELYYYIYFSIIKKCINNSKSNRANVIFFTH